MNPVADTAPSPAHHQEEDIEEGPIEQPLMAAVPAVPAGRVAGVVGRHVESVTRFGSDSVRDEVPETFTRMHGVLTRVHEVTIGIETAELSGQLRGDATPLPSYEHMAAGLKKLRDEARAALAARLDHWAALDTVEYRRLLPANGLLRGFGKLLGYEFVCGACAGYGRLSCSACSGNGNQPCHGCGARGKISCYSCHGTRRKDCAHCQGRGSKIEHYSTQTWDPVRNAYSTENKTRLVNCYGCSGGKVECTVCDYAGKISCGACAGRGHNDCVTCSATGKVNCGRCAATGWCHCVGHLTCSVQGGESLALEHPDSEAKELVRLHIDTAHLPDYGALDSVAHRRLDGSSVRSDYRLHIDVASAHLLAGGQTFAVLAFGRTLQVFDFRNVAGHLLLGDLERLEQAVREASRWKRTHEDDLLDTTGLFVESELNLVIAEAASQASGLEETNRAVQARFQGLVDADYVNRASAAFHSAVGKLFAAQMFEPGLYCIGLVVLAACAMVYARWPVGWPPAWTALGGGALVWAAVEIRVRRQLRRRFPADIGQRMTAQIDKSRFSWRVRTLAMAVATALTFGALWGVDKLQIARGAPSDSAFKAELNGWRSDPMPDLSLRKYPEMARLSREAAAGNVEARIVLGWRLVLGANGVAKDIPAAAQLFEQAAVMRPQDPLVRVGRVVALMNTDAMPQALREGGGELARIDLAEAGYWLARLNLAPQSPLFDLEGGIRRLRGAADRGHASAAFALGKRYLNGDGVPRDAARAKHYLGAAATAGAPEARKALTPLQAGSGRI